MFECFKCLKESKWNKPSIFIGGVLFGTAGIKILASKDAKKLYTNVVATALRAKDCVMKTVSNVQENTEDILAEAKQMNEERYDKDCMEYGSEVEEDCTESEAETEETPE